MSDILTGKVIRAGRITTDDGETIDGVLVEVSVDAFKAYKPNLLYQSVGIRRDLADADAVLELVEDHEDIARKATALAVSLDQSEKANADYRQRYAQVVVALAESQKSYAEHRLRILQLEAQVREDSKHMDEQKARIERLENVGRQLATSVEVLHVFIEAQGWETDVGIEHVKAWEKLMEGKL